MPSPTHTDCTTPNDQAEAMTVGADAESRKFLDAFLECRLSASQFDHRGHLRIAWLLLNRLPLEPAIEAICTGIERLATQLGAPGKYHRTLSEALVRLMAAGGASQLSWEDFLAANAPLVSDVKGTVASYYSAELLGSVRARTSFVPPDLRALPACPS